MDEMLICVMFDKVKGQHVCLSIVNSKEEYIRSTTEMAINAYKNLNDLQPKIIGKYNVVTGVITPMNKNFGFDCYKIPASKAEALAPLGVDFSREALDFEQWKKERAKKINKSEE